MPICIECSYPVSHLYSAYSRADDRSQGKGVRLTQCPRCQRFADKYVEYDFVVLFIDLVLIKPQVYRHLLFNRLGRDDNQFDRSIIRLGILLLLFDVYLTWARIEKDPSLATTFLSRAPIIVQYLFFLSLNAAATLAHHLTVRLLASILVPKSRRYSGPDSSSSNVNTNPSKKSTGYATPFPSGPPTPTHSSPSGVPINPHTQNPANPPANILNPTQTPSSYNEVTSPTDLSPPPQGTSTGPQPRPAPPLRRASTAPLQNIRPLPPPTAASPSAISTALLRQPLGYPSAQPHSSADPVLDTAGHDAERGASEPIGHSHKDRFGSLCESSYIISTAGFGGLFFVPRIVAGCHVFFASDFYAD
ncbi:hypothetical protein PENVUL_c065G06545 [Penicillium vulpinum]|uniref:Protein ARV n=1 Tax=Penicillium vulpinum TaxID=29845 RepID=A0A1V6RD60_9EURO|nr:hypothetical protein PENVUL_c065G06545 [Penicillium vulpinum]